MTSYILLENIRFFAYHGVAPQETTVGNEFIVSLRLKTDITRAIESDDVADTVNYAEIHQAVKEEMEGGGIKYTLALGAVTYKYVFNEI